MHWLWATALSLGMMISLWSMQRGVALYLAGALIFPSLSIGSITLRIEIVYCLWLFMLILIGRLVKQQSFLWHPVLSRYSLYLLTIIIATLLALLGTPEIGERSMGFPQVTQLYGHLRPLLVLFLFLNIPLDQRFVKGLLWMFIWLSIPLALLSIAQSFNTSVAEKITMVGYTSPWRTPVFGMLEKLGFIVRSTGVFESPVYNAVYFLLVLLVSGFFLLKGEYTTRGWGLYLALGLALVGGITTLSSTFLLGSVMCLGIFLLFLWHRYRQRFLRIAVRVGITAGLLAFSFAPWLMQESIFARTLRYQVERILSGSVLETRYDPQSGILVGSYQAIKQKPILGWGFTQVESAFVGDSLYVVTLYRGGIIGLLLFLWVVWGVLRHTWRNRKVVGVFGDLNQIAFLSTLLLLAVGIGSPSFFILRLQEWYWALVGMSLNRSQHQTSKGIAPNIRGISDEQS